MKKIAFSIAIIASSFSCGQSNSEKNNPGNQIQQGNLFTVSDAEKILGEPAHLTDSSSAIKGNVMTYSSAYFANTVDSISGKTGGIYLLFEKYEQISFAQQKYTFIKTANEKNGINELDDLGDEAYFHTDGTAFYFIMVRKGVNVFSMKVNKITSKTSLKEFNLVAKKITQAL